MMTYGEYKKADIQDKLKFWIELPHGTMLNPLWEDNVENWDTYIRDVCTEALTEIQFLRRCAGAVSRGPDFAEIRKSLGSPGTNAKDA